MHSHTHCLIHKSCTRIQAASTVSYFTDTALPAKLPFLQRKIYIDMVAAQYIMTEEAEESSEGNN